MKREGIGRERWGRIERGEGGGRKRRRRVEKERQSGGEKDGVDIPFNILDTSRRCNSPLSLASLVTGDNHLSPTAPPDLIVIS